MKKQRFSKKQVSQVRKAFEIACDIVGDKFHVRNFSDLRSPVELCTISETRCEIGEPKALAQVQEISYLTSSNHRAVNVYQVALVDHAILELIDKEKREIELQPLLVYILVHELIHVMRFTRYHCLVAEPANVRGKEETQVHTMAYDLLKSQPIPGLDKVLERFSGSREAV